MKRREFITLLSGAAPWPLTARAQQPERMRRIGVLMSAVEGDQRGLESITAFAQGLAELGWIVGRNVRIEYRWGAGDLDLFRRYAAELIALSPDVVLATAGSIVGAFRRVRRVRHRHRHDRGAAGKAVRGVQPGRCHDRAALRRHWSWPCHHPQARAHDGRRCGRGKRAGQGIGVHGAAAGRRDTLAKAADGPIELGERHERAVPNSAAAGAGGAHVGHGLQWSAALPEAPV